MDYAIKPSTPTQNRDIYLLFLRPSPSIKNPQGTPCIIQDLLHPQVICGT